MSDSVLEIRGLSVETVGQGDAPEVIVDQVDLQVQKKQIVSLLGGSGSGKTTTGLSVMRLLPSGLRISAGEILFQGEDLAKARPSRMRRIRGAKIAMIFQDPLNAFNPVFTIGNQIDELLVQHTSMPRAQRKARMMELLKTVGVTDVERVARSYPHQLSGGLRQRAMIAQAIALNPDLIIADEPTSSLDVTLQARILELFCGLRDQMDLSFLLITHDLGIVRHMADEVVVMANKKVYERGSVEEIMEHPRSQMTLELKRALDF